MSALLSKEEYTLDEVTEILGLGNRRKLYTFVKNHKIPYYKKRFERPKMYFTREVVDWLRELKNTPLEQGNREVLYKPERGPVDGLALPA